LKSIRIRIRPVLETNTHLCLKVLIQKFYQLYDEFIQNRTKLESDVFNHFYELRFQIDEHREELEKRIDVIALAMIYETKKYEVMYFKNFKEDFSSFDDYISLEH
jgi:hypothetical protein